jgi:hypothetical protein
MISGCTTLVRDVLEHLDRDDFDAPNRYCEPSDRTPPTSSTKETAPAPGGADCQTLICFTRDSDVKL